MAAINDHLAVCEFLVKAGAVIRVDDNEADRLSYVKDEEIHDYLESVLKLNEEMRDAAEKGDLEKVAHLLGQGAQTDGADYYTVIYDLILVFFTSIRIMEAKIIFPHIYNNIDIT